MGMALCISGVFPLVVILVYTLFLDGLFSHNKPQDPKTGKKRLTGPYRLKDRLWEFNCGFLGLVLSQALAFVITQALKTACGKPRPDVIDRCQPNVTQDPTPFGLSNYTICQGDPEILKDGFRSWPSGHSSSSFAGLLYISLWIGGKLHIMDNRGEVWKTMVVMVPILAATLVCVSRIMDARHHPFDVITGGLLGAACATVSYRQYFPSLSEPWKKGRAYPIRTWASEPVAPVQTRLSGYGRNPGDRESIAALRNPDEEQMDVPEIPVQNDPMRARTPPAYPVSPNPYMSHMYNRRPHDNDGEWSSSSEDLADGFEMQTGYTQTRNPLSSSHLPTYEVDSAYHSRGQSSLQPDAPLTVPEPASSHDERVRSLTAMR